jgi:hypothetical protein
MVSAIPPSEASSLNAACWTIVGFERTNDFPSTKELQTALEKVFLFPKYVAQIVYREMIPSRWKR